MYRLPPPRLQPDGTADSAHDVTPLPAWRPALPQALDASRGSDGTFCLYERHRTSREHDTMAVQLAQHLATALGQLLGLQLRGAQPCRPIGCQGTVCAEPVTESSGMPYFGAKKRLTNSPSRPGAVTMTPRKSIVQSCAWSGMMERMTASLSNTTT